MSEEALSAWLAPIAADQPSGRDARHEPEHERIRGELENLSSLHGKAVNWALIRADGQALLQNKSKDLSIAAYLGCAWAKLEGLDGLARGMSLLSLLLTRFPEGLQPLRPRARANALSWFAERAAELPAPAVCSAAEAASLRSAYAGLLASARACLGDDCPSFSELGRSVERVALSAESAQPTAPSVGDGHGAAPPVPAAEAPPSAGAPDGSLDLAKWLASIPGPARAGVDASQEDAYFALQGEIEKLQSLEGARPNWERVSSLCSQLLITRSKDFAVAGHLTLALTETRGLEGLLLGLRLLLGMLDSYWDEGFPPPQRIKRRSNALSFVFERLALALPRAAPHKTQAVEPVARAVAELEARVSARFAGPDAPSLTPLREALSRLPETPATAPSAPAADPASSPGTESPASPSAASAAAASPGPVPVTLPTVVAPPADTTALAPFLASTAGALVEAARALFEADPGHPSSYRLLRIGLWLELEGLPSAQGDGRTRMRGPDKRARDALASLIAAARWDAVLIQSEAMLRSNPLWLDSCWISARALEALGESHAAAKAAVEVESRALTQRLPQLLELRFMDAAPLASPEASGWFRAGLASDEITPSEQAVPSLPKALQSTLEAALGTGDAAAGRELENLLRSAPSAREAFRWRLSLSKSVENLGKLEAAAALYLGLERDVDLYRLEDWEPELAREVFSSLWALLRRKASLLTASDAQRICARLARLSPLALT